MNVNTHISIRIPAFNNNIITNSYNQNEYIQNSIRYRSTRQTSLN